MSEDRTPSQMQTVLDNLGAAFRHLFPGALIMGAASIAFPCWFQWIHTDSWPNLAFAGVVALTVGNVWFTLNRYIVHQGVDLTLYVLRVPGPGRGWPLWKLKIWKYPGDLANYVKSALSEDIPRLASKHVIFRSSSVLFIYTVAEVGLVFSNWHDPGTLFARHPHRTWVASVLIFGLGVWQHVLTRVIDSRIIGDKYPAAEPNKE
jgi:hypothetical protein